MDRAYLIAGDTYLTASGRPIRLIINRLYTRTGRGENPRKVTYSHVTPGVTSARGARSYTGEWTDFGYPAIAPKETVPGVDYEAEMRAFPIHQMLDELGLPVPGEIPPGYELYFITSLQRVEGPYAEAMDKRRRVAAEAEAVRAEKRRTYNELAELLNPWLGRDPLPVLEQRYDRVPDGVELSFAQAKALLKGLSK